MPRWFWGWILHRRLPELRKTLDAGANASVLPALNSFGAVVAALPAFAVVRDGFLAVPGGPLVSIAVAANVRGGITGSASGGLTIALNSLGKTYGQLAADMETIGAAASAKGGNCSFRWPCGSPAGSKLSAFAARSRTNCSSAGGVVSAL